MSTFGTDPDIYDETNRMVPGTLKNEFPDAEIKAVVILNCKCYAILPYGSNPETIKCKGVCKYLQRSLSFQQYYDVLMNQAVNHVSMNLFKAKSQQMYLVTMKKISLSALNTKVFYTDPKGICSLPYGHTRIKRYYT